MDRLKAWWAGKGKSDEEPASEPKLVRMEQLPLYPEKEPDLNQFRFIEEGPLPGQKLFSDVRTSVQRGYRNFMEKYGTAQRLVNSTGQAFLRTKKYVEEEGTVIPKAMAITVGGMSGFLFGMRRGGVVKRGFYSAVGMATVAAFCYPYETVDLTRNAGSYVRTQFKDFAASPTPPPPVEKDISDENSGPSKDIDMEELLRIIIFIGQSL